MEPLFKEPTSTVLFDRNGELLGASVAADGQWRFPPSSSIPDRFATCLIQFEDRHFLEHHGLHLPSLVRAFQQNHRAGRVVSGGSTLTMQVARLSRGTSRRSYLNKLVEALLAIRIDLYMEKEDVLALFCANAPFGGNVVGLEAAAWRYYGRPPDRLSWSGKCHAGSAAQTPPPASTPVRDRKPFAPSATGCWTGFYSSA